MFDNINGSSPLIQPTEWTDLNRSVKYDWVLSCFVTRAIGLVQYWETLHLYVVRGYKNVTKPCENSLHNRGKARCR